MNNRTRAHLLTTKEPRLSAVGGHGMTSRETTFAITRRGALRRAGLVASLPLLALASPARAEAPSGRLEMDEVEIALLFSAGWGHGTLFYEGTHGFKMKGLGVGGLGVSKLEAFGNVFRLTKLSDFPGAYGTVRWPPILDR
jgi:hypothetical protein